MLYYVKYNHILQHYHNIFVLSFEFIQLVQLPAEINVVTVLESFVKTFMMEFWSPNYDRAHFCHNAPKIAIDRM